MSLDAFAEWDGAYVMGVLSADDRRAYEDHLAGCAACREAVAELAGLPGLLARAPRPALEVDDEATGPGEGPRSDLVALMARRLARGRLRRRIAVGLVAAAAVVAAIVVPLALRTPEAPGQTVTLAAVAQAQQTSLRADVGLTPTDWGTRLVMECEYLAGGSSYGRPAEARFALVVTDTAGEESQVSTWSAAPGDTVRLEAGTAVPAEQIAAVEIRNADGKTLLVGRPDAT